MNRVFSTVFLYRGPSSVLLNISLGWLDASHLFKGNWHHSGISSCKLKASVPVFMACGLGSLGSERVGGQKGQNCWVAGTVVLSHHEVVLVKERKSFAQHFRRDATKLETVVGSNQNLPNNVVLTFSTPLLQKNTRGRLVDTQKQMENATNI